MNVFLFRTARDCERGGSRRLVVDWRPIHVQRLGEGKSKLFFFLSRPASFGKLMLLDGIELQVAIGKAKELILSICEAAHEWPLAAQQQGDRFPDPSSS